MACLCRLISGYILVTTPSPLNHHPKGSTDVAVASRSHPSWLKSPQPNSGPTSRCRHYGQWVASHLGDDEPQATLKGPSNGTQSLTQPTFNVRSADRQRATPGEWCDHCIDGKPLTISRLTVPYLTMS